jgi:O-antigen/teichoic acid export membrane protein
LIYSKIRRWISILAFTGAAQAALQAIGFLSGIFIIRMLPIEEYAYYTLANTILGAMIILADSGVGIGVYAQGAKVWRDKSRLGIVLSTGMRMRKKFAIYSAFICFPIMLYLLSHHGASFFMCFMIGISIIFALFFNLSNSILETPVRLHQDIFRLQSLQIKVGLMRAVLILSFIFIFPIAAAAIICGAISQYWGNRKLRYIYEDYVSVTNNESSEVRQEIQAIVKRKMPEGIFFIISGQVSLWLITAYGTTLAVAQVGVLSRLAIMMSIISAVIGTVAVPRFARLEKSGFDLVKYYFYILIGALFLCLIFFGMGYFFPEKIIFLIGNEYSDLNRLSYIEYNPWFFNFLGKFLLFEATPVLIMIAGATLGLLSGLAFSLNSSRGLILPPSLAISYGVIVQIFCISVFDFSQVRGLLAIGLFSAAAQFLLFTLYFLWIEFFFRFSPNKNL